MNKTPCFSPAHILLPSEQIPVGQGFERNPHSQITSTASVFFSM